MQDWKYGMTAKEYLLQVRKKEAVIARLKFDKENLREILCSIGGTGEGERVQSSRNNDRFGSVFARIDEKDCLIAEKLEELVEFKVRVSDEISTLSDARYIEILHKRYIRFMSFEQIAVDMGYSYRYVTKMHGYALLEFERGILGRKGKRGAQMTHKGAQMTLEGDN